MNSLKEEPISLLSYDPENKKYHINDEALDYIRMIPKPISVIAVAGLYRTGKSYLLNRMLLSRPDGFGVGPTINPCTKGLWIWSKPLKGFTASGEPVNVLIIDSEGIGALDEDSSHDNKVFSLAILLSSCFIYNSVGSIDEQAIQNLSLVINLSRNIHIKSNESLDSLEDFTPYFPSFLWIVRDFALQLVDFEGESISSKEYLENSLNIQKGYSESIETKNRVRRLLTTYFKERDCCTLIRPLTNEENLQNLDKLNFQQLRPEFISQINNLREKILQNLKIKQVKGLNISGEAYSELIINYVNSINNGAVPNIENAWISVCKREGEKILFKTLENYENECKIISEKLPITSENLLFLHKNAVKKAKNTIFDGIDKEFSSEIYNKFKEKAKIRLNFLITNNNKEIQRQSEMLLQTRFKRIENLENIEFNEAILKIEETLSELKNIDILQDNQNIYQNFFSKKIIDLASLQLQKSKNEIELQKLLQTELQKKKDNKINELNEDNEIEKSILNKKITEYEKENVEKTVLINSLQHKIGELEIKIQRNEVFNSYGNENQEKQTKELKINLSNYEEKLRNCERETVLKIAEFEKEKALLLGKLSYYEKNCEEAIKKEKETSNELRNLKKELSSQMREISMKGEQTQKNSALKIDELMEKNSELEMDIQIKDQKYDSEIKRFMANEDNLNSALDEAHNKINNLQKEIKMLRANEEIMIETTKKEIESALSNLNEKLNETQHQLSQKEEKLKQIKTESEKEKAILLQKTEFLTLQLRETEQQLLENKKAHDSILKALDISALDSDLNSSRIEFKQIDQLKETHRKELKSLEIEFENNRKRLLQQIESITEKYNDYELRNKLENSDLKSQISTLKETLENSELARIKLLEQYKQIEQTKVKTIKELEDRYQNKIKQIEKELEEYKNISSKEITEIQNKSEQNLSHLKTVYELERERLEKRLIEEKDRHDKRMGQVLEEWENKIKEEQMNYEEEIEVLRQEIRNKEDKAISLENEIDYRNKTVENLEKLLKETKENLVLAQNNTNSSLEQQMNSFTNERRNLQDKIDLLSIEINKKDKELNNSEQLKLQLTQNLQKKENQLENIKKDYIEEKSTVLKKLEETKESLQKISDEYLEKKIEYAREVALSAQQNEFLTKKIEDLQKQNDNVFIHYEEKLKNQKTELQQDFSEKITKISEEKYQIEQKYEKARKSLKEIEATYNKQLSQLEKERSSAHEKSLQLENKLISIEAKLNQESSTMNQNISNLKDNFNSERRNLFGEIEKFKGLYIQNEQEKSEILTNYERDKVLWEGKFTFLEGQKEQAKQDLVDALKKFELTLQHLKRARNNEKDEQETNLNELLMSMEKKYQSQITDLNENHIRVIQDYEDRLRKMERELKNLNDKLIKETQGKLGHQLYNENKLAEMLENEKIYKEEIEELKNDRESKLIEFQRLLEMERENFKSRLSDFEFKFKESESRRNSLIFEHEKEKAKWSLEKDHLITQRNELQDYLEKMESRKDTLLRENAKLRNESRVNKRSVNLNGITNSNNSNPSSSFLNKPLNVNISLMGNSNNNLSNLKKKNLIDITNFSGIMAYDPTKTSGNGNYSAEEEDEFNFK